MLLLVNSIEVLKSTQIWGYLSPSKQRSMLCIQYLYINKLITRHSNPWKESLTRLIFFGTAVYYAVEYLFAHALLVK